jgi:hypothetical protein
MSARLDPNELGAAGAILSAVDGVFHAVRGQNARLADAYRSLALALDRLAMTSHAIPSSMPEESARDDEAPAFDRDRWREEIRSRLPKLTRYNTVEPLAQSPGDGKVTVGDGEEDLLEILEELERFAHYARQDRLEEALFELASSRAHWRRHLRDLQKLLEAL